MYNRVANTTRNAPDFIKSLREFIQNGEYYKAENALFDIVYKSFIAGWVAAGGDPKAPTDSYKEDEDT